MGQDNRNDPLGAALTNMQNGRMSLARELRRMATASKPYDHLSCASPWDKNIWRAAAEFLDPQDAAMPPDPDAGATGK